MQQNVHFYSEQGSWGRLATTKTVQDQALRDWELREGGHFGTGQGIGCAG